MERFRIRIISSSVRNDRKSHRVALFFEKFIKETRDADVAILDLNEYRFPIFSERLRYLENPDAKAVEFSEEVGKADGIIIVTPEYNGGYPASIINAVDLLISEWRRKPVAISTVSDGSFGGSQCLTSLQFSLWKIRALTVTAQFPVPDVEKNYDESGNPSNPEIVQKRATAFINELYWFRNAVRKMAKD